MFRDCLGFVEKLKCAAEKVKENREWRVLDIRRMSVQHEPERRGERVYDVINA